MDRKHILTNNL